MKTGVFTLIGPNAGKTMVILDKYPFTDGVFKTNETSARLMERILTGFYGCKLTFEVTEDEEVSTEDDDTSLAKANTKGQTTGEILADRDLAEKLRQAEANKAEEAELAEQRAEEQAALDAKVEPVKK